jgi:fumarate reductase flavoprotein subunit
VFDDRILALARQFPDFVEAEKAGVLKTCPDLPTLAALIGCNATHLEANLSDRTCGNGKLSVQNPPYHAIKVTGALFHTQGGLDIDAHCRVLRADGSPFPNLLAAGGAARGVSGNAVWGYLSGNGLLSAMAGGAIAAASAQAAINTLKP